MDPQFQPLMDAAYEGNLACFKALVKETPQLVSQRSATSHPSLLRFIVVDGGLGKIPEPVGFVQFMIEMGAPLGSNLVAAASVNARAIVDTLLEAGASVESCRPWTALEEALYWAHQDMAIYLWRERGARVQSLRAASELGAIDLMREYFDEDGAPLPHAGPVRFPFGTPSENHEDVLNQALILSLKNLQYNAASLLLEKGADINAIPPGNHEQCTALHQAVYKKNLAMIDWLIDHGAVATVRDSRFYDTAIGWAEHFGYKDLAKHLAARSR